MKKIFTLLAAMLLVPWEMWGQSVTGDFTVSGEGTYEFSDNSTKKVLTVSNGNVEISTPSGVTDNLILIKGGTVDSPIKVTLNAVKLENNRYSSIEVENNSVAVIELTGDNTIEESNLEVGSDVNLTIKGKEDGKLTINPRSGYAIGGYSSNNSLIKISDTEIVTNDNYGIGRNCNVEIENSTVNIAYTSSGIEAKNTTISSSIVNLKSEKYGTAIEGGLQITGGSIVTAISDSQSTIEEINRENWNGIVFERDNFEGYIKDAILGVVYGNVHISENMSFIDILGRDNAQNTIFVIPEESNLTFSENVKITPGAAKVCYGDRHEDLNSEKVKSSNAYYQIKFEEPNNWDSFKDDKDSWEDPVDAIEVYENRYDNHSDEYNKAKTNKVLKPNFGGKTLMFGRYYSSGNTYIPLHLGDNGANWNYDDFSYDDYEIASFTVSYDGKDIESVKDKSYQSFVPSFIMPNKAVITKNIQIKEKEYDLYLKGMTWLKRTYYNEAGEEITETPREKDNGDPVIVYAVYEVGDEDLGKYIMRGIGSSIPSLTFEPLKSHLKTGEEQEEYRVSDIEYTNGGTRFVYKIEMPSFEDGTEELLLTLNVMKQPLTYYKVDVQEVEGGEVLVKDQNLGAGDPYSDDFVSSLEQVRNKEKITVDVNVDDGFELVKLYYKNGETVTEIAKDELSGEYSFTMPSEDVSVYAEYKKIPYIITIGNITNGTLKIDDDDVIEYKGQIAANAGSEIIVTPVAEAEYKLQEGSLQYVYTKDDNVVTMPISNQTFIMPEANITLIAKFIRENEYIVTISDNIENGTITIGEDALSEKIVQEGDLVELNINPAEGYELLSSSLTYTGENGELIPIKGVSFKMPAHDVIVNATFTLKPTTGGEDEESGIAEKRYRLYLADQDFYLNDEYDEAGLVLYSRHDKKYTDVGGSFTVWFEKNGEVNEGARVFISNRANGEYKEVKLDEVSGYYQIRNVQSNIYVKLYTEEGFPVANESIEATEARAYAQANKIVVITPEPTDVQIISMAGAVVATAQVAGQQEFANLAEGVYIVRMGMQVRN